MITSSSPLSFLPGDRPHGLDLGSGGPRGGAQAGRRGIDLSPDRIWVQEALGHMPWPVTTVIHVPLGVLLFALALGLTFAAWGKEAPAPRR